MNCAWCVSSNEQKELIAQEKKKSIRSLNGWEANKSVRATQAAPNKACIRRLGATQCAFFGIVLSFGSFPFPSFSLPCCGLRTPLSVWTKCKCNKIAPSYERRV
jgi:hypothetical protein